MLILLPFQLITGVLLWDIKRFADWISLLGGIKIVDFIHVVLFFSLTAFLIGHVYLTTLGTTLMEHIKAMFTGYEEIGPAHETEKIVREEFSRLEKQDAVTKLTPHLTDPIDKKIVELLFQGNKQKEIAEKIGISTSAVNQRIVGIIPKIPADLLRYLKELL
jgi:hypothetical protein